MSMISEQVKELRNLSSALWLDTPTSAMAKTALSKAADTIESLSAKLQAANMEQSVNCGSSCLHWDLMHEGCTIHNTAPGGCKDFCAVQKPNNLADCGGWILCKDRLPTMEECQKNDCRFILDDGNRRYGGLFDYEKQYFVQFDFWKGLIEDKCAIAWQTLPEPYHEP